MVVRNSLPAVYATILAIASLQIGCYAATIGNVSTWSTNGQNIQFNISDGSKLLITVLAEDLIKVRFAPSGSFSTNVSRAVVKNDWPPAIYTTQNFTSAVWITTSKMRVEVQKTPCVISMKELDGTLILGDDPSRRIQWESGYTRVYKTTQTGEAYLGLGWRPTGGIKRNGTRFTMRNVPTYDQPDVFYGGIPFWYGFRNGKAYGVFFDDTSWGEINVGQASSTYMYFNNLGGQLEYYFFYGPTISSILNRYTELTGRPFMPPKWACGYQQSRWSYIPQSQVLSIANEFRSRSIPCDVIYLDIDYMSEGRQLTFNPSTFPNPSYMCSALHSQGFHIVANIGPWLLEGSPMWVEANNNGYLIKNSDGSVRRGWHDYIYFVMGAPTGWVAWVDFTKTTVRTWYAAKHTSFLNYGIDGIWNDLNEPQELGGAWPTNVKYNFDGANVDHNKTSTQYSVIQSDFSYDVLKNHYPNKRPFVLSRGAYAGIQRSAAVWSGDNTSDWINDFKRNIPMGLSMSISGQPHNGHDIGGFYGYPSFSDPIPPELFARWMQAGVFSAFCRGHHHGNGSQTPFPYCEPWRFGTTVENISRDFISLRYRLMPYLYSLFYDAHTTGAPIQRPTVFDFQNDSNTLLQDYDFMFGPFMLVAPVYTPGATTRSVYLPAGTAWIDWWSDARYTGGQTINVAAPLERVPIFVREGGIIPMSPVMQFADEVPITELTLRLYPSASASSFTLFEDDGVSWEYQTGRKCLTTYAMTSSGNALTLDIGARNGSYTPEPRHYLVEVHRWPNPYNDVKLNASYIPRYATKNELLAAAYGYYHDTALGVLYVRFPDSGEHMVLNVQPDVTGPVIQEFRATNISPSGQMTFRAKCSDLASGMKRVEFWANGAYQYTVYGEQPEGCYYFNWIPSSTGVQTIEARAYDNASNSTFASIAFEAVTNLRDALTKPDGTTVALLQPYPVTVVLPDGDPAMKSRYIYVEDTSRRCGLRVRTDEVSISRENGVRVFGVMRTITVQGKSQIERYLDSSTGSGSIAVASNIPLPKALGMNARDLADMNRGLLVTVWGRVSDIGSCDGHPYIHITDGSLSKVWHDLLALPGSAETLYGLRIYSPIPAGLAIGSYVLVTGVSSQEVPVYFDEVNRVVRTDSVDRISVVQ